MRILVAVPSYYKAGSPFTFDCDCTLISGMYTMYTHHVLYVNSTEKRVISLVGLILLLWILSDYYLVTNSIGSCSSDHGVSHTNRCFIRCYSLHPVTRLAVELEGEGG
jgi:hypothetical protein